MAYLANRSVTQRNTAVVASTLTGSTITTSNLTGSTLQTQTLSLQSTMIGLGPNTQSTFVNASQGSYAAESWNNTTSALTLSNIRTLGMSSTGQYQLVIQDGNETVYLSSTSGQTWSALGSANGLPTGSPAYKSAAISADGSIILVAIEGDYLYRSTNSGLTFSAINTSSPQIYLPLDGNTTDVAGGSSPAVTGSVSYVPGPVTGQAVSLVNTAGSAPTNYIRGSYSLGSNFTLSCWFNMQSYPANSQIATILSVGGNPAGSVHIYYVNNNAGRTGLYSEAYILNGPAVITAGFAPNIELNTWYHVYVIYQSAGVYSLYLNGSLMGSISGQTLFNNPTGYGIGTYSQFVGAADAFNGYIDDVRLMNSAITNFPLVKSLWSKVALSGSGVYALAGNTFGRVFSSSNGGSTWTHQSTAQAAGSISDIELSTTGQYQAILSQKVVTPNQSGLAASTWTQNGVNWTASASSVYSSYSADKAFNNNPTSTWASNSSTYNGSGTYAGAVSTTIQGGVGPILGEWLQLQSSTPLILYSYTYGVGTPVNQLPKSYYIVGSNDGSTWYPLQYVSMTTSPFTTTLAKCSTNLLINYTGTQTIQGNQTGSGSTTAYPTSTSSYLYFRLIFVTTYGGGVVELSEFYPNFLADNTFSPQQTGLITSTWQTSGITWNASASSVYSPTYPAYRAFNNTSSSQWVCVNAAYNTTTGIYGLSASTTIVDIGNQLGEWIQIDHSVPLVLTSYSATATGPKQFPKTYYIVGSNDKTTWYPVQYATFTVNPFTTGSTTTSTIIVNYAGTQTVQGDTQGSLTTATYSYTTQAFTSYRFVVTAVWPTTDSLLQIDELYLNFLGGQNYSVNYGSTWSPAVSYGDAFNVTKNATVTSGGAGIVTLPAWKTITTGFTISIWFVLNSAPITNSRIFVANTASNQGIGTPFIFISFLGSRVLSFTQKDGPEFFSTTTFNASTLYHVVWTSDGLNHRIYINGTQESTASGTVTATTYPYVYLGKYTFVGDPYPNITYRDFRMFNRGLTAAEVAALYANQNYGMPSLPLLSVSGNGKYAVGAKDQNLYVDANYLSGFGGSSYTNPTLTGINATISDVAVSHTGQYMVLVTAGTTNNVYYSVDYGSTFTSLTIGSAPLFNCDMSADGSRMSVSGLAITYTLNRNSTGFSIALGSQAGRVSQATNAVAIGNQAATWNQSANSIVVNATGSQVSTLGSGLYVAPIADAASSASISLSLLGYGTDQQVVQTGLTTYTNGSGFSGNVGIGTSLPLEGLHSRDVILVGSTSRGLLRLTTSDGVNYIQSGLTATGSSVAPLYFTGYYGGPIHMAISSNGYVGIGTTNPMNRIHIHSAVGNYDPGIAITHSTTTGVLTCGLAGGAGSYAGNAVAGDAIFRNDDASKKVHLLAGIGNAVMTITSSSVGIGVTTPIGALEIKSAINFSSLSTNPIPGNLFLTTTTGNQRLILGAAYTGGIGSASYIQSSDFYNSVDNVGPLILNPLGGNVGIGTSTPNAALQLSNTVTNRKIVLWENANDDHHYYGFGINSATLRYQVDSTNANHIFYAAASGSASNELMRIQGNGNVGIGTTNPSAPLHISASGTNNPATNGIYVYNTSNTAGQDAIITMRTAGTAGGNPYISWDISDEFGWSMGIDNADDNKLKISASWSSLSSATKLVIDMGGNVGIGTNNPGSYKLYVQGDIYASGNITGLSDRRFKTQIEPLVGALDRLSVVNGYTYFRSDHRPDERQMGLIAQEVQEVYPEAVTYDNDNDRYGVNYGAMIAPLIQAMKEMRSEYSTLIGQLKEEISSLKAERPM